MDFQSIRVSISETYTQTNSYQFVRSELFIFTDPLAVQRNFTHFYINSLKVAHCLLPLPTPLFFLQPSARNIPLPSQNHDDNVCALVCACLCVCVSLNQVVLRAKA